MDYYYKYSRESYDVIETFSVDHAGEHEDTSEHTPVHLTRRLPDGRAAPGMHDVDPFRGSWPHNLARII